MNKKAIFGTVFTLSLAFGGLNSSPASALDEGVNNGTVAQPMELGNEADNNTSDEYGVMPISETNETPNTGDTTCADGYVMSVAGTCVTPEEAQNIIDEGTANEPLVVCTDESEPGCESNNTNPEVVEEDGEVTEVEPETWPLIVSLSVLGATVVFVIIINLFGRQK